MGRIAALWNKGLFGKILVGLGGVAVVCCVLGVIFRPRQPNQQGGAATALPAAAVTQAPPVTADPADTPAPTEPPATIGPTATPEPTKTPTPIPATETPVPPVVLEGNGQAVTDPFVPPAGLNRVFLTHNGERNFIVRVFKPDGKDEGLANEIGDYAGVRPLVGSAPGEYYFEIDADGAWSIRVEPIVGEPDAADGLEGRGDYVSGVFDPAKTGAVPYDVSHTGERNFIVHLYCAGGDDSVQNEIGAVSGSTVVRFADGPCFWDVQADGGWSLKPK